MHSGNVERPALVLTILGSLCWETAAIWGKPTHHYLLLWFGLIGIGLTLMILGFLGGLWEFQSRVGKLAVLCACLSPVLWLTAGIFMHPLFPDHPPEHPDRFPIGTWLVFQVPLCVVLIWMSAIQRANKVTATFLIAAGLICLFLVHIRTHAIEVAQAPHLTGEELYLAYKTNPEEARKKFTNRRVVVSGTVSGDGEGLFGSPSSIDDVQCDDVHVNLANNSQATVIGTCKGLIGNDQVVLWNCRRVGTK